MADDFVWELISGDLPAADDLGAYRGGSGQT